MSDPAEELAALLDRARELLSVVSPGSVIRVEPALPQPTESDAHDAEREPASDREAAVLETLLARPLTAKQIARAMQRPLSGPFTVLLSRMRHYRSFLGHEARGYVVTPRGRAALDAWRRDRLF